MAHGQYKDTTIPETQTYGTSSIPQLYKYPNLLKYNKESPLNNQLVYIFKHYGYNGLSVYIMLKQGVIIFGDWKGNKIDMLDINTNHLAVKFMKEYFNKIIQLFKAIKLNEAQLFITTSMKIADVQISQNKFASPAMVIDLFGRVMDTIEVVKAENLNEKTSENMLQNSGSYTGNLVIKPAKFKLIELQNQYQPMYAEVIR